MLAAGLVRGRERLDQLGQSLGRLPAKEAERRPTRRRGTAHSVSRRGWGHRAVPALRLLQTALARARFSGGARFAEQENQNVGMGQDAPSRTADASALLGERVAGVSGLLRREL